MAKQIGRGNPVQEMVKGSIDYTLRLLREAFYRQFPDREDEDYWITEVFAEYIIVKASNMQPEEFYRVGYAQDEGTITFEPREAWELVELTYQPVAMQESLGGGGELVETTMAALVAESVQGEDGEPSYMKLRGPAMTAGVVNANGRRYSAEVLREAVAKLQQPLAESQLEGGRLTVTGEADHPSDKGARMPRVLETVTRWDSVSFDGKHVMVEGIIIPTAQGRDLMEIAKAKVRLGISMRGYGHSVEVTESGRRFQDVTALEIMAFDIVDHQWKSDPEAEVVVVESKQDGTEEKKMDIKELKALLKEQPDLAEALASEMGQAERKVLAESLGVKPNQLEAKFKEAMEAEQELAERNRRDAVAKAIDEACKDLPYGELNGQFIEAVRSAAPEKPEAVEAFIEAKRVEWDAIMAKVEMAKLGEGVDVKGPVFEQETGVPEFARASYELTESMRKHGAVHEWHPHKPQTPGERYAARMLEAFDREHKDKLQREWQMMEEAGQTSDLNLPYSVSRAIVAEALPALVSASVFDLGMTDQSPTKIFYETFAHESGVDNSVTDESVTADEGAWIDLDYARVDHGTVVVTTDPAGTTYVEGTDYVIDYVKGRIMTLAAGDISDGASLLVDYDYTAYRLGEMQGIKRAKMTLASQTLDIAADRLAAQISREAIVFSRSQLGYDLVGRTLTMLATKVRQKIDGDIFYHAISAAMMVANNSGGTWDSSSDTLDTLVEYLGYARVKVQNRYYEPTSILMSVTNSDRISNWDGFTSAGSRADAEMNGAGYVGRLKGLPVFSSTEWPDSTILVPNRQLVMHRVFRPMMAMGPFPSYDTNAQLIAADQYYIEEFNGTDAPVPEKGAYVRLT